MEKILVLHGADQGLIPGTPEGLLTTIRSDFRIQLGVTQPPKRKIKEIGDEWIMFETFIRTVV